MAAYTAIHERYALTASHFIVALFAHDFLYYAYHRASHRVNVLWAVHVVHHQSRYYDLTVSLRQGTIATWVTYAFYLPLALFVSPLVFLYAHAVSQLYQFFVHTEVVRRLGIAEWLLATPSHHRVHHGRDDHYLDSNYGGIFIVFDRLLGTFTTERERPDYGVRGDAYDHASPAMANLYLFARLARLSSRARGVVAKLRVWFGSPERTPGLASSAVAPRRRSSSAAYVAVAVGLVLSLPALFLPVAAGVRVAIGILALAIMESGYWRLGTDKAGI